MGSSDSDTDNECFESAEESLDESNESESKVLKSKKSLSKSESEVPKPVVSVTADSIGQVEGNTSKNSLSYRKRPERVKRSNSRSSSQPVPKSFSNEVKFSTDKIVPDVFFQDITSNLSKNINKSLNTLQQTSSNVKDLILNSLPPVSSISDSESFAYDDKTILPSVDSEHKESNAKLDYQSNTQLETIECATRDSAEVTKESHFDEISTFVEKKEKISTLGKVNDNVTITKPSNTETLEIKEECFIFNNHNLTNVGEQKISNYNEEDAGKIDNVNLNSDIANHAAEEKDKIETLPEKIKEHVEESCKTTSLMNSNKIPEIEDNNNERICKTNAIKISNLTDQQQNEKSDFTESKNPLEISTEELDSSEAKSLKSVESKISSLGKNILTFSDISKDNENLADNNGKNNFTDFSKNKENVDSECNLEELKLALKNIVMDDKIILESANEVSGNTFMKENFSLDEKVNVCQTSSDGWDDFDFSDDDIENINQSNNDRFPESDKVLDKQIDNRKVFAGVKHLNDNTKITTIQSKDSALSTENVKQNLISAKKVSAKVKSADFNSQGSLKERNYKETEKPKQAIESKSSSDDVWDWDNWDESTEEKAEDKETQKPENKRNVEKDSSDISNWSGWDTFGQKPQENQGNWSLGSWGVDVLLNKATAVTQGLSNVLEAGLGAPDPETLVRLEKQERERLKHLNSAEMEIENKENFDECSKRNSLATVGLFPVSNITSLVAGVTSKIVEHSKIQEIGSKVISGGLDTLETLGKKTMEVLQEGDPGLKNKSALLLGNNKPVLSQVLREAREKAEKETKRAEEKELAKKCHFETLFDDFQGMIHLEALEMLSRQCELKLDQIKSGMNSEELEDLNGILEEVVQLCSLDEYDTDMRSSVVDFKTSLQMSVEPLKNEISIQGIIQIYEDTNKWLKTATETDISINIINQKLVSTLAELAAATVHQFHKSGELLSIKECRKTVEEVDALLRLTSVLCKEIQRLCDKFVLLSQTQNCNKITSENVHFFNEKVALVMQNSTFYIKQAFDLLIPVIQLGAAV